jgi:ABC-type Fe3+-hydroxamate transport system substrate-binding protein
MGRKSKTSLKHKGKFYEQLENPWTHGKRSLELTVIARNQRLLIILVTRWKLHDTKIELQNTNLFLPAVKKGNEYFCSDVAFPFAKCDN